MERLDGAKRPALVTESHGDGLATVTYLPGASVLARAPQAQHEAPSSRTIKPRVVDRAAEQAAARAERVSMNALTRRGMSKREVERSLVARELDDQTVASELERLEGVGLIDDMALAQNLVGILQ